MRLTFWLHLCLCLAVTGGHPCWGQDTQLLSAGIEMLRQSPAFEAVYKKYLKSKNGTGWELDSDKEWTISVNSMFSKIATRIPSGKPGEHVDSLEKSYNSNSVEFYNPIIGDLCISRQDLSFLSTLSAGKPLTPSQKATFISPDGEIKDFRLTGLNIQEIDNPLLSPYKFLIAATLMRRNKFKSNDNSVQQVRWIDIWNQPNLTSRFQAAEKYATKVGNEIRIDVASGLAKKINAKSNAATSPSWQLILVGDPRLAAGKSYLVRENLVESPWTLDAQEFAHSDKNVVIKTSFEYAPEINGTKLPVPIPTIIRQAFITAAESRDIEEIRLVSFKWGSGMPIDTNIDPLKAKRVIDVDSNIEIEK